MDIFDKDITWSFPSDIIKEANPVRRDADIRNTMGFGQTHLLKN